MSILDEPSKPVTLLQRERQMRPDLAMVGSYIALSILGLLMVYTASISRLEEAGISPTRDLEDRVFPRPSTPRRSIQNS